MPIGILGRKKFMTRVFLESGEMIPVTVLSCPKNTIDQVKTLETDGYTSIRLAAFPRKKATKTNTHYIKKEIRSDNVEGLKKGDIVSVGDFADVKTVKVISISKGKGFQGVVKRHNFKGGPSGHGSKFHRQAGTMGNCKPSRTVKGMKMGGRMGGKQVTLKSVDIIKIDRAENLIALKGSIPGGKNSFITLIAQ